MNPNYFQGGLPGLIPHYPFYLPPQIYFVTMPTDRYHSAMNIHSEIPSEIGVIGPNLTTSDPILQANGLKQEVSTRGAPPPRRKTKPYSHGQNNLRLSSSMYQALYGSEDEDSPFETTKKAPKKKNNLLKLNQNVNRNIVPCIVQHIVAYISKESKSLTTSVRIFQYLKGEEVGSVKNFYAMMRKIKSQLSNYVNEKTLWVLSPSYKASVEIYQQRQRLFYLKMARILTKHYLETEALAHVFRSKRLNKTNTIDHLRARRRLLEVVQGMTADQESCDTK